MLAKLYNFNRFLKINLSKIKPIFLLHYVRKKCRFHLKFELAYIGKKQPGTWDRAVLRFVCTVLGAIQITRDTHGGRGDRGGQQSVN